MDKLVPPGLKKRRVLIIGCGITGASLAAVLSEKQRFEVVVVEQSSEDELIGSTGHAPGYVGIFNEVPVLTELALESVACYKSLVFSGEVGFKRVGGLEVACTEQAMTKLRRRAVMAQNAELSADILNRTQTIACAAELINPNECVGGVFYGQDGTANARAITSGLKHRAKEAGARFVYNTKVTGIESDGDYVTGVLCGDTRICTDDVVLACGIWGPAVAELARLSLPLVPVAHPYVYGPVRVGGGASTPFVRWPEHHVYARDHGDRLGIGTYDHVPVPCQLSQSCDRAEQAWFSELFDPAMERAFHLLASGQQLVAETRLNGIFSMTPDNLPLLGRAGKMNGVWIAEALWVTHAYGAAKALAGMMAGDEPKTPGIDAFRPDRFTGQRSDFLQEKALRLYRDIYASA